MSFSFIPKNMLLLCEYTWILMSIYEKYGHAGIHVVLNRDMLAFLFCVNIGITLSPHNLDDISLFMLSNECFYS